MQGGCGGKHQSWAPLGEEGRGPCDPPNPPGLPQGRHCPSCPSPAPSHSRHACAPLILLGPHGRWEAGGIWQQFTENLLCAQPWQGREGRGPKKRLRRLQLIQELKGLGGREEATGAACPGQADFIPSPSRSYSPEATLVIGGIPGFYTNSHWPWGGAPRSSFPALRSATSCCRRGPGPGGQEGRRAGGSREPGSFYPRARGGDEEVVAVLLRAHTTQQTDTPAPACLPPGGCPRSSAFSWRPPQRRRGAGCGHPSARTQDRAGLSALSPREAWKRQPQGRILTRWLLQIAMERARLRAVSALPGGWGPSHLRASPGGAVRSQSFSPTWAHRGSL